MVTHIFLAVLANFLGLSGEFSLILLLRNDIRYLRHVFNKIKEFIKVIAFTHLLHFQL
jgi:hypothetical protein